LVKIDVDHFGEIGIKNIIFERVNMDFDEKLTGFKS
jgi:hypothetical protein